MTFGSQTASASWWMNATSSVSTNSLANLPNTWGDSVPELPALDYEYPAAPPPMCRPFDHQRAVIAYGLKRKRFFNLCEIGMGKTLTTVWNIDLLMRLGLLSHVLVIAPRSTMEIVWQRTLNAVNSNLWVKVLSDTAQKRIDNFKASCEKQAAVTIINPDGLHILSDKLSERHLARYDLIVVDETALFRNRTSRRYKALNTLSKSIGGLWGLSGSPMPESPLDIYPMAKLIAPGKVPMLFSTFRERTMFRVDMYKWMPRPDAIPLVAEMLKDHSIRFTRNECLDLPPTQFLTHEITATPDQTEVARLLKRDMILRLEAGQITVANEAVLRGKLLQVFSGSVKLADGQAIDIDASTKYEALELILTESNGPVIVYVPFIASLNQIANWLKGLGIKHAVINGAVSDVDRVRAFDAVQSGTVKVLLAHPKAMAHGITLTRSNVIVWWTPPDSNDTHTQANGRVTRPGQERQTLIVYFTASALEKRVVRTLSQKERFQGLLLDYLRSEPEI